VGRTGRWFERLLGVLLILIGFSMVGPSIMAGANLEVVRGRLVDVYHEPRGDEAHIALVFEYPVHAIGPDRGSYLAFGSGRADAFGSPLPDLTVPAADAPALIEQLVAGIDQTHRVFYDPADPIASARLHWDAGLWRYQLGLILLLTPIALWASRFVARRLLRRRSSA
jgi:hypothetical protein